uniref:Uncharacterized protein n=1 Tax=Ixodes ricinus TaxID=34613 RepID=A0A6B0U143_IXORI
MLIGSLKMSWGVFSATSSMSTPPAGLATMTGPLKLRSIRMARYVSRAMSMASAIITLLTSTPSFGVCFVTNL